MRRTQAAQRGRGSKADDRPFSDDRLLNAAGWAFMLLCTAAGMGLGFRLLGMSGMMLPTLLAMAAFWGAFEMLEPAMRGRLAECRVRLLLRRHDVPAVHDVYLSTPDGRQTQLDHVAFLGRHVAVIETKSITGVVERRGGVWSRLISGRERRVPGRTPQQQALDARDVLLAAYPAWGRSVLAVTVLAHGSLGEGFAGESWVVAINQLGAALGRFRQVPDEQGLRRWRDLARFLAANRRTRSDRWRFWRTLLLNPATFGREQLVAFGMLLGAGVPLVIGSLYYPVLWLVSTLAHGAAWLSGGH